MNQRKIFTCCLCVILALTITGCQPAEQKSEPGAAAMTSAGEPDRTILPFPDPGFSGTIDSNAVASKPDFPVMPSAPKGAPNVIIIMTDDVGYGASSTFGGPIATPTFDKLAANGLRYNQFHTTALCSPTRAALISGRNHHNVASGVITEMATGFPGYNSLVPKSAASVGEILKQNGYNTSWWGKMHNVPDWMSSTAGPFDLWPSGLGFEYFYGFIGGDANQWRPALYENTTPIDPYIGKKDYILDKDLADRAINYISKQNSLAPDKPFFMYYCTGTAHAPHHAPKDWIEKYKGKFDGGWDATRTATMERQKAQGLIPKNTQLTTRPDGIPAWESLSADQKKVYARFMEVYAGALSYADYNIGRVIDAVEKTGELDNTIIIYIMGDNGASAEGTPQGTTNEVATAANGLTEDLSFLLSVYDKIGGPETYNHYSYGWAHAMNTPFQWTKQVASHFGGTRNGLVISYPKGIKEKGAIRSQFHHVIDIVPTILDVTGLPEPKRVNGIDQKPMDGTSMAYTFNDATGPSKRNTQYFELVGNRAIYHDGWVAATTPYRLPWQTVGGSTDFPTRDYKWELYNIAEDYSEANNLAAKNPEKLKELQALFYEEAKKNNVLPLDASFAERADPAIRPSLTKGRKNFEYYEGSIRIPEGSAPDFKNKSWSINAEVEGGNNGVLATLGGYFGGFALLVKNGKPMFIYRVSNQPQHMFMIQGPQALSKGHHTINIDFAYDGGGLGKGATVALMVDGKKVAEGKMPVTVGLRFSLDETWDIGEDTGTPLDFKTYDVPFKYNGELQKITVTYK
ncbi:arylsulfatase [Flavihumibacter fluvii]|uniref:arylsulfatase n=1 Tax=Flavihumibacter fluvii TaxID=2838157 RepID=UPI001BDE4F57|nr:arylsulfatase [Flavihumibacter fluvii]ULQ53334.1 arylsulfatase [Flavihumibacter fluvii]